MAFPLGIITFPPIGESFSQHRRLDKDCQLPGTPPHLKRALYIPRHTSRTEHIPVYDITTTYTNTVRDVRLGTTHYMTKLCLMRKPDCSTAINVDVRYLVYFDVDGGEATIEERCLGWNGQKMRMSLPINRHEHVSVDFLASDSKPRRHITPSYPLPDTSYKDRVIRHPYFSISADTAPSSPVPSLSSSSSSSTCDGTGPTLEWQVHPEEHGAMRYTLVDVNDANPETSICAIYHHAGLEFEMPDTYSEGVLLLPDSTVQGSEDDALAVSTALALLWMIRRDHQPCRKKKSRFGGFSWARRK